MAPSICWYFVFFAGFPELGYLPESLLKDYGEEYIGICAFLLSMGFCLEFGSFRRFCNRC